MTPEGKVKAEIKAGLDRLGAYYFMPVQAGYGARTVDILACIVSPHDPEGFGRFVAIECKAAGNKPTKHQEMTLRQVEKAGGVAVVAYSWADVEKVL